MAPKRSALAFPGTPYMAHSVVRVGNWKGPCLTVRNAQTSATRDIGFKNNVIDLVALRTFLGNATGYVTRVYDQTGNGRHLVQATTAQQPSISANYALDDIASISIDGTPDSNLKNLKCLTVGSLSLSTQSLTCLLWDAQLSSLNLGVIWAFLTSGNVAKLEQYTFGSLTSLDTPGLITFDGATANRSASLIPKIEGCMLGVTGSASALIHYLDGSSASYAAAASNTVTQQIIGNDGGTSGYNSGNLYCNVVYNTALSAGDVALVRRQMAAAFSRGPTKIQIVVDSNSNDTGYASTNGLCLWRHLQDMLPRNVSVLNQSIWGNTATNADTYFATNITPLRDTSFAIQMYLSGQGVNDITGGLTGAQAYAKVLSAINKAKAAGFNRTGMTVVGSETGEYGAFNTLARAGEGVDFDVLLEGPLDPRIDGSCYTDNHLNNTGQLYAAQTDSHKLALGCGF